MSQDLLYDVTGETDGYTAPLPALRQAVDELKARDWTPSVELSLRLAHAAELALQQDASPRRALDVRATLKYALDLYRNRGARLAETNILVHQRVKTEHELGGRLTVEIQHQGGRPLEKRFPEETVFRLSDIGISKRWSSEFQRMARHDWADYDAIFQEELKKADAGGEISTAEALRICRHFCQPGEPVWPEPPVGTFDILYADPPWRYDFSQTPEAGLITSGRSIEKQYPTASVEDLCAMPLPDIAPDAMLFLWATNPKLAEAMQVMDAWGFTYRTNLVWLKDRMGMGYYAREQHELLLIGKRGNYPAPVNTETLSSVIRAPRLEHSAKPPEVYALIERMYPEGTYVELFARGDVPAGWSGWGNEHGAA